AAIADSFLAAHGLGIPMSAYSQPANADSNHSAADICGATILVSAAGAAAMQGLFAAAPNPAPGIPDVVVVVYGHGCSPELSLRNTALTGLWAGSGSPAAADWCVGDWASSWSPQEHQHAVTEVRAAIARGDVYQVNLVGHASASYQGDPGAALRRV